MMSWIRRLHRDERGDAIQVVIIVALIIIPLVMVLIYFGDQIQQWLSDAFQQLTGKKSEIKTTL
jgi:Flp pilus assembly pilin Flp